MNSFSEIMSEKQLTQITEFSEIAQAAIEAYYLIPYPGKPDLRTGEKKGINRKFHGGIHAASVTYNLEMLLALYQKYKPSLGFVALPQQQPNS